MRSQSMLVKKKGTLKKFPFLDFRLQFFRDSKPILLPRPQSDRSSLQKDKEIVSGSNVLKTIYRAAEMGHRIWSIITIL